ncbi:MAG: hypothetical protein G01um10143_40 [Parcubacteria group bacterium Gr01-1014_3]|nr:MAG: hypothetical protein G01um10143_40 [Parcubacteria group bacterium Gr01-1014_3]
MADEVEIFEYFKTPLGRNPKLPPFIVEQSDSHYRVTGTFRSGVVSPMAVPQMNFRGSKRYAPWSQRLSKEDAVRWTGYLNKLHADGHIDWSGGTPAIIPAIDRLPKEATKAS